ncbi:MAG: hypothetical protein QXW53_03630 [Desulfurococcaceae archaeon]
MVEAKKLFLSEPDFAVKTYIIAPHNYLDAVSTKLLELGVLEVITPERPEAYRKEIEEIAEYYSLLENGRKLYEELTLQLEEEVTVGIKYVPQPSEFKELVRKLVEKLNTLAKEVKGLNELAILLKSEIEQLELFRSLIAEVLGKQPEADTSFLRYSGSEIVVETFQGSPEQITQLQEKALYTIALVSKGEKALASLVLTKRDYNRVIEFLPKGVERLEIVGRYESRSLKEVMEKVGEDLTNCKNKLVEVVSRKKDIIKNGLEDIALLKVILDLEYEKVKTLYEAVKSHFVAMIIGWVPGSRRKLVENLAEKYPVQVVFEEAAEPPAEFSNLKLFRPFELITEMNGAPAKTDWDPTPLITYAFVIFYGLMMADVGYSLGLLIATKYVLPLFVEDPNSEGVKKLQKILYIGGFSGIVMGILSKSFFGELLGKYIPLPQQLINTMDATQLIALSLVMGWVWIFLSHVLALVKNVKKLRDIYGALFELSIIIIMVLGTLMVLRIMYTNRMIARIDFVESNYNVIKTLLIVAIIVLVLSRIKITGPLGVLLWLFDVVGILGDVFSFIRIAGIALGSAILAYIFNCMIEGAAIVNIGLGVLAAIGLHFFAFALTPIGPFVHSLRLCILEISSKFYEGMNRRLKTLRAYVPSRLTISGHKRT